MRSAKKLLLGSLSTALAVSGLTALAPTAVQANPAGTALVISEVYGGGGFAASGSLPVSSYTHDFIELYNPTDTAVSLSGWAVFYGSGTRGNGASLSNKIDLSGEIPAHGHYLVQGAGNTANGAPMPASDASGGVNMSGSSGVVVLSDQTATLNPPTGNIANATGVVDAVGYGTANTFEAANQGTTLSGTTAAHRSAAGGDTDSNAADFSVASPTPTNAEGETEPVLTATDPVDVVAVVNQPLTSFDLTAASGTAPYAWSATGLPAGVSVSTTGTVSGTPTVTGTFTVTATVTDAEPGTDRRRRVHDHGQRGRRPYARSTTSRARARRSPEVGEHRRDPGRRHGRLQGPRLHGQRQRRLRRACTSRRPDRRCDRQHAAVPTRSSCTAANATPAGVAGRRLGRGDRRGERVLRQHPDHPGARAVSSSSARRWRP